MTQSDSRRPYSELLDILRHPSELFNETSIPGSGQHEELFSVERLEQYAASLAVDLQVSPRFRRGRSLLRELKKDGQKLVRAYLSLAGAIRARQPVSPAAEWFVDNFHIIEDQLREIKQNLPDDYYHGLPQLAEGELKGVPRVYALALAIIAHTDSRFDANALQRFLLAFQQVAPLKIGELWAIAITLRIALVQHLTPISLRIVSARENRERADVLAERLLAMAVKPEATEKELVQLLSRELGEPKNFNRAVVVQLIQRIRDQDPAVWPAFDWLEKQLNALGTSAERITQLEHHRQAASQVTVGNIIASMRLLSSLDWHEFFESVSLVDRVLEGDPAGAYAQMDFGTRDRYRHALERIAKRSELSELEVAAKAIGLSMLHPPGSRMHHVGFALIGGSRSLLEHAAGYRPQVREWVSRLVRRHSAVLYLCALAAFTAFFLVPVVFLYTELGVTVPALILFGLVAVLPASELALSLLHHYVNFFVQPRSLPRMETEKGIPPDARTMVVIPTIFSKIKGVRELVERLEIHALANPDPGLSYALLGDYGDANSEVAAGDEVLLETARSGIQALNARHCVDEAPRFHLFHRRRQWNPSEGKWIGWERKRGKLLEFNRLLRGATDTSYTEITADYAFLKLIQFVITLDSDTQLPRDAARKLIGTIIHPLNRPQYDAKLERVTAGYGILQPRISISSTSAAATRFARAFSGNIGIDPYTTAVSDVYQDLFGEGTFTGKGLYVVDAFELAMENRVPENTVLSHDLFESAYARSALVTDVELIDDYPSDYDTFSSRQHRWTRGDWQIGPWLFPWVPSAQGGRARNQLSLISRWKIFDNLRRSLVAPASLFWLLAAWTILPGSPAVWTALVVLMFLFPVYSTFVTGRWMHRHGLTWRGHISNGLRDTRIQLGQIVLTLAFLPQQAWTQLDAIARVFYRKLVSHNRLLEWTAFAQLESHANTPVSMRELVHPGPLIAVLVGGLTAFFRPEALPEAAPFALAWFASPWLKRWIARKPRTKSLPLGNAERAEFRAYSRLTWHFFETFVGDEEHWLAPDNFQEDPLPVVAHRTSPTNIGLQLLSIGSAYDLGYVGHHELIDSVEKTFETLGKLPGMHGHFFNWYDTRTLEPLHPRYISTVDSGNLAGHLLTFKQFLLEIGLKRRTSSQLRLGVEDTLLQLDHELARVEVAETVAGAVTLVQLREVLARTLVFCRKAGDGSWLEVVSIQLREAHDMLEALAVDEASDSFNASRLWMRAAVRQVREFIRDRDGLSEMLAERGAVLQQRCNELVLGMDFSFLFDESRKLFVIGYNVTDDRRDNSYYDLLASESRLASFVAIAKGDVPQEHWFRLGRQMAPAVQGRRALIAWTATMFEYLMPVLIMRRYPDTLLDQTYEAVVERQVEYGNGKGVPWGISEAGFNARDLQLNYQYGPFGIPGLGLKRGLSDELVVSPYSTFLAALIDPWAALLNLRKLRALGALSRFGFYESIDYTTERLPKKQKSVILRSFMAHHQGMSLIATNNILNHFAMQRRFHAEPLVKATQLLLQERIPQKVALSRPRAEEVRGGALLYSSVDPNPRSYSDVNLSSPRTQLLSNGNYSVMVTSTGAGYSRCGPLAVTRWREDPTRDHWGQFFYIRAMGSGRYWSAAYQPTTIRPKSFEAAFSEDKVEFIRRDGRTVTHTEILVSPEDSVELRRVSVTNKSREVRDYEITSFMEVVLARPADDQAHSAFSNLFVQTEYVEGERALLATRRRRATDESQPWGFHVLVADGETVGPLQYETDRARFLGRGRNVSSPAAMKADHRLSATVGSVLDPVFSLRRTLRVQPGGTARVTFSTGVARSREEALSLIDKYHNIHIFAREAEIAWTQSQVQLRHLNITIAKAHTFQKLASRIIYLDSSLRPRPHVLVRNTRAQSSLWAYGISGDLPILLTRINDEKDMAMVRELLHAHEYLRLKGLSIDLVILNERAPSYLQALQDELQRQIRMSGSQALMDKPGGVFLRRTDLMPAEDVILLRTVARVTLNADRGTLDEQLKYRNPVPELPSRLPQVVRPLLLPQSEALRLPPNPPRLDFFNGVGGFTHDTREYVIVLNDGQWTPAPWVNVIANSLEFGFIVSESGAGYTWSTNSRENRLTPWSNDPVGDPVGEAIYLRDEVTGEFWSPTPLPIRGPEQYVISHGQGYTRFEHTSHGIEQELQMFVAPDAEVKLSRLRLKNTGSVVRKLSVTSYAEWVLGAYRGASAPYVIPEHDLQTDALIARNPYNNEFASRVAFADLSEVKRTHTCDRKEFLGRNGGPANPAALKRIHLSGTSGAGLDPCAAFQSSFELAPGEERVIVVVLGEADSLDAARLLIQRFRNRTNVDEALVAVKKQWDQTLSAIEIKTPDGAMNTLVNRWLPYQTLSCRLWARSGFYQSGGAYGFRDQLQDVMALVYSHPEIARQHLLRAAARQFKEGDVQHWWHPPTGRGVRTHFSDDLIWLPFVTAFYVRTTGDIEVLKEIVPFIEAPELKPGQEDSYTHPQVSSEKASLLEHCARALDRSLKVGVHGLPLMGSGDWNDGMNRVGHEGRGESVWVGWFLHSALQQFIPFCEEAGATERVSTYLAHLRQLKQAIEQEGWDGDWYRRAYFDDGTPLGTAKGEECRIDSIAQSWSVLSGAGDPERARRAMASVDTHLVQRENGLIGLFTPPFDHTPLDPGYIKGYVPGVRENGGQYTHAAIWTVMAYAELGDGDRAVELFSLLNPINHASTRAGLHKYKVEPYVIAADVYGLAPHTGRGGWTWYTGSASWMYRAALESILGFELRGDRFRVKPRIPLSWREFEIIYRPGTSTYRIVVSRDKGSSALGVRTLLNGVELESEWIPLGLEGSEHEVRVWID